ncbi:DEAD/DEAH box helicase [bacterium]|nr:DEAD/DEAH box helicase [bacterium]
MIARARRAFPINKRQVADRLKRGRPAVRAYERTIPLTDFKNFNLNPALIEALSEAGYTTPTPIQEKAIPLVMTGRDLLGIAQTGTGKTAAFALPILHRLAANRKSAPKRGCRALILSPTRELATQIAESFRTYGSKLGFSVGTVFGGVSHRPQSTMLARGVDVLVAAPGRLLDHLAQGSASLGGVEIFVLDEADQMLDMGFILPIRRVVKHLPADRQNLFFSATMPTDIGKLAAELLTDPLKVEAAPQATTAERVNQQVVFIEAGRKPGLLIELFARDDFRRVLVFSRTKRGADKVSRILEGGGVTASAIHGNKSQNQRERALAAFKAGEVRALVATDIAARGIDISSVTHVVQYDLPDVPESYVHRIGRTARAGKDGSAVAFCADDERGLLRDVEKVSRQKIPSIDRRGEPALAELAASAVASRAPEPKHVETRGPRGANRGRGKPGGQQPRRSGEGGRDARGPRRDRGEGGAQSTSSWRPEGADAPRAEGGREDARGPRRRRRGGKGGGEAAGQGGGQSHAASGSTGGAPRGDNSQKNQGGGRPGGGHRKVGGGPKGGRGGQASGQASGQTQGSNPVSDGPRYNASAKELMRFLATSE